jgi:carbonic anhydrase
LQQLENLKNFDAIGGKLQNNKLNFYALWFDVYSGEVYMFSFKEKCFIKIDDANYNALHAEFQTEH